MEIGQKKLRQVQHILIYLKGDLVLLKRNEEASYEHLITQATPAKKTPYLLIKTISHYLVRLNMILNAMFQKELTLERGIDRLNVLRDQLITLQLDYPDIVRDEKAVIDQTVLIITDASSTADLKQIQKLYKIYYMKMKAHHKRYGRKATEHQLRGLEEMTSRWLLDYTIDLKSTYIIIVGSRGPKKDLIEKQYFDALRTKHGISPGNTASGGVIYVEMLPAQMDDINYSVLVEDLARDVCNQEVAERMLKHRKAMYKDVLSRHAKSILAESEVGFWRKFQVPQHPEKSISKCPFHR